LCLAPANFAFFLLPAMSHHLRSGVKPEKERFNGCSNEGSVWKASTKKQEKVP
jgi:hypothetical protein